MTLFAVLTIASAVTRTKQALKPYRMSIKQLAKVLTQAGMALSAAKRGSNATQGATGACNDKRLAAALSGGGAFGSKAINHVSCGA